MNRLLVSGDSFTSCWPLEEELGHRKFGWPNLVSKYFDIDLVDKSRAGSSNYRIYRKAFEGLIDQNIDFVLVFLTSWTRFETGNTKAEKPSGIFQCLNKRDLPIFEHFFNGYKNYSDTLRMISSLQAIAEMHRTPCYYIDTFRNNIYRDITIRQFKEILKYNPIIFDNMDDNRIQQKFKKIKNIEKSIDWSKFISKKSYQELIDGCPLIKNHPGKDGHKKMSEIVIQFIEEVNNAKAI